MRDLTCDLEDILGLTSSSHRHHLWPENVSWACVLCGSNFKWEPSSSRAQVGRKVKKCEEKAREADEGGSSSRLKCLTVLEKFEALLAVCGLKKKQKVCGPGAKKIEKLIKHRVEQRGELGEEAPEGLTWCNGLQRKDRFEWWRVTRERRCAVGVILTSWAVIIETTFIISS